MTIDDSSSPLGAAGATGSGPDDDRLREATALGEAGRRRIEQFLPYAVALIAAVTVFWVGTRGDDGGGFADSVADQAASADSGDSSDDGVVRRVRSAIDGETVEDLRVTGSGDEVTLTGTVATDDDRARIVGIAAGVSGVSSVRDRLTVGAPGAAGGDESSADGGAVSGAADEAANSAEASVPADAVAAVVATEAPAVPVTEAPSVPAESTAPAATAAPETVVPTVPADTTVAAETTVAPVAPDTAVPAPTEAQSAPPASAIPAPTADEMDAWLAGTLEANPVLFEVSDGLTLSTLATLDQVAAYVNATPAGTVFEVAGHTDSRGDRDANQLLSETRAQTVADYLVSVGVPAERLRPVGYGESQPISNDRAENRRVEVRVIR